MLIGIIVGGIVEEYTYNLRKGIEAMASDDVRLVTIPVKYFGMDYDSGFINKYAYCFNSSASFCTQTSFDGLIIEMGSLTSFANEEKAKRFADTFKDIPHVFISYENDEFSNVSFDNSSGMDDALEYMYANGAREFALLCGPEYNADAIERKDCFERFVKRNGIRLGENYFQYASFYKNVSVETEKLYQNNPDADVFVCANDIQAKFMCQTLVEHGRIPGKDVSVLGFDDSDFCITNNPTIASVRTDVVEVGKQSFSLLMDSIAGKPKRDVKVPSRFILRGSICHRKNEPKTENDIHSQFREITRSNILSDGIEDILEEGEKYYSIFCRMDNAQEEETDEVINAVNNAVEEIIFAKCMKYIDWELFVNKVEEKYRVLFARIKDSSNRQAVTMSYISFLKSISKYTQTLNEDRGKVDTAYSYSSEQYFREVLHTNRSTETNYFHFLENMDFLGVKNAFLYLYDEPISYVQEEEFILPEKINLKAVLRDSVANNVPIAAQKIDSTRVFDNDFLNWDGYSKLMLFPIYAEQYLFGVIICDMKKQGYKISEMFTNQISAGIRMLQLRIENNNILNEYEETLRKLKENNITLDTMSKTDPLTGLNNRRGFYVRAENMLGFLPNDKMSLMVCYADMNDLKIVNDRYGHEEGDSALKVIASRITDFVTMLNGFAARIGGDEFAFLAVVPADSDPEKYKEELYGYFDQYNKTSNKPYSLSISVGYYVIGEDSETSIEDAMAHADAMLYVEKANKKRIILKSEGKTRRGK